MKTFKQFILENNLQDNILDKMIDNSLTFDKLDKFDQHYINNENPLKNN